MESLTYKIIGRYHSSALHPYDVGRQPDPHDLREGVIELAEGHNFQQALIGLESFTRLWILFHFDRNINWQPMVQPPRGERKQGVFATRSPYRPNGLGLSNVRLLRIEGLKIFVQGADLLDNTPVLDLKPYLAEVDAHPEESLGWLQKAPAPKIIEWSAEAHQQISFLEAKGLKNLKSFCQQQLEYEPFNKAKKRILLLENGHGILAYRTWRLEVAPRSEDHLEILRIFSGYSEEDLESPSDRWQDKDLHRAFNRCKSNK